MSSIKHAFLLVLMAPFLCIGQPEHAEASQTAVLSSSQTQDEPRTIQIYGINRMKYVVIKAGSSFKTSDTVKASNGKKYVLLEKIEVAPGQKIRLQLTSIGTLPAASMSHNWILLQQDVDLLSFSKAASQARDNGYIPEGRKEDIIAHTDLASGGETVEVTFTAPEKKGAYDYLCSFPGHFQAGMKGKLIVK